MRSSSTYFDETDVCRRLIDRGWVVEACERGFVEHTMGSELLCAEADRVLRDLYPLLKSADVLRSSTRASCSRCS